MSDPNTGHQARERELYLSICLYSDKGTVETITEIMGVPPERSGDAGSSGPVEGLPLPRTFWMVSTRDIVSSLDLNDHLDYLVKVIPDLDKAIDSARSLSWDVKVIVTWVGAWGVAGPAISHSVLERVSRWRLGLQLDHYIDCEHPQAL